MPTHPPDVTPQGFSTFGDLLRYLRERAHLSQRELAALVGYHFSYISYLEKNTRMVDEAVLLGRFVPALELEDKPEWVNRLLELSKTKKGETPPGRGSAESTVGETKADGLPPSLTSMIGREYESARFRKLLLDPAQRLVSLLGPPGVGKTRLALHVARMIAPAFRHGVAFVDLAPVRTRDGIYPAIATAVGIPDLPSGLADKNILLLLDNFEQLAEFAPELLPLLAAPELKLLVTSREVLRLNGEQEFHLAPLPLPSKDAELPLEHLEEIPSIRLFLDRARAVHPEFMLDEKNASIVTEICSRLDGLPLALELAAARTRSLSLLTMLEQFDRRFQWLTQGARDLPAWRQTLQGAIEWSVQLLSDSERTLFQRLSVFSGGWTLEAAEEICSDESLCRREEILNLLMQLADKSLILPENEDGRFHFLETLREYASTGLAQSGGLPAVRARHCEYFLAFVEKASPHLRQGGDELKWLSLVERERDNLRQALAWSTANPERADIAMRLGFAVHIFWLIRGHSTEARAWLSKILALDPAAAPIRANLLRYSSDYAAEQGDFEAARALEEEALSISRALGDEVGIYLSMDGMAVRAGMQGDYARAAELLGEVLAYRRRIGDNLPLTGTLNNLAIALRRLGRLEESKRLYEEAIQVNRKIGNSKSLAHALNGLAEVHIQEKKHDQALNLQKESLMIRVQLGDQKGISVSLDSLATSLWRLEKSAAAVNLASAADWIRKEIGVSITPAVKAEKEAFIAGMRAELGEEKFHAAWLDGQTMPLKQVIELVEKAYRLVLLR